MEISGTNDNCLTCLSGIDLIAINKEDESEIGIGCVISKHFWFSFDEYKNKKLCLQCWTKIEDFHQFYTEVEFLHEKKCWQSASPILEFQLDVNEKESTIKTEETLKEFSNFDVNDCVKIELSEDCDKISNDNEVACTSKINEVLIESHTKDDAIINLSKIRTKRIVKKKPKKNESDKPIRKMKTAEEVSEEDDKIRTFCSIICELCGEQFKNLIETQKHYKAHHGCSGYISCCNRKYYKRVRLVEHIQRHINPDAFRCDLCSRNYVDNEGLNHHKLTMHTPDENKKYKCTECPKSFLKPYQLEHHKAYHIPKDEQQYTCEFCKKRFGSAVLLKSHVRARHEPKQEFICDICAKTFNLKSLFEKHRLEHDESYESVKMQCTLCGAWLKNKGTLRHHMHRHNTDGRLFFCDICGKQSPNKYSLRNHIKLVHLAERTFKCTLCEKAFKKQLSLKEHIATHTGEVLYNCPYCTRTFISNANMAAHRKKMHPKEWLENKEKQKIK